MLDNVFLQVGVPDRWMWQVDPEDGYSVRGVYDMFTHLVPAATTTHNDIIWNKIAP
jgi:hypothetical protein